MTKTPPTERSARTEAAPLAAELRNLSKSFGSVVANADISLKVRAGTVHAIVGENGAGKSTAMKMLYGMFSPDEGEILIKGQKKKWSNPKDAVKSGLGMVHQHFMLAGPYTAFENIILGTEFRAFWPGHRAAARAKLEDLAKRYGLDADWERPTETLPVGVQQRIEILKLLYRDAELLILDEPTAVLTPQETVELFAQLKSLCQEGRTVVIITHKLKEVMDLADDITVFRAGRVVAELLKRDTTIEELAELMVGRKVRSSATLADAHASKSGAPVLSFKKVTLREEAGSRELLGELDFSVRSGEIVGIAGVEGNGQSELLQILLHARVYRSRLRGEIEILGRPAYSADFSASAREIKDRGVGFVPEDRHHEGLLLGASLTENFVLGLQRGHGFDRRGWIDGTHLRSRVQSVLEEYDVRPRVQELSAGSLSGGNQQKLIIAREFEYAPKLLIAAQPTRGVDIGAIEFIHTRILKARSEGCGVLLISSELDEVLDLSDRILVIYRGKINREFSRLEADSTVLGRYMGGGAS